MRELKINRFQLHELAPGDEPKIQEALRRSVLWEDPEPKISFGELVRDHPRLALYYEGFGRNGDVGYWAEVDGKWAGAAWCRLFAEDAPGYGFVASETPELGIAVSPHSRGMGIGGALLDRLIEGGAERGFRRLSLSVHRENSVARSLYLSRGFRVLSADGITVMMLRTQD